jgi:hypothetical protein
MDLRMVEREGSNNSAGQETAPAARRLPRLKFYVRPRWILLVLLAPFIVLGLLVLAVKAFGLVRYDSNYFAGMYLEQYSQPGDVARALETALQTDDEPLLTELQALRWPEEFETGPSIIFVMLWERTDRFITYLYFDMQSYERHPHYVELVDGRYVVTPEDLHYYLYSGQWKRVFYPLAIIWWTLGFVIIGLVWVFRVSEGMRARLYGE